VPCVLALSIHEIRLVSAGPVQTGDTISNRERLFEREREAMNNDGVSLPFVCIRVTYVVVWECC
jgi:hypothetical protein